MKPLRIQLLHLISALGLLASTAFGETSDFAKEIEPILAEYCFDCHADGASKGDFALDDYENLAAHLDDIDHWMAIWENTRAHIMPPSEKKQPSPEERKELTKWIEFNVFGIDPANPDPGRVTARRLNRDEYQYTIKDVLGYDFDSHQAFPADDTGYGFDNIGEVLTISPLLMEKYLAAAKKIVADLVPADSQIIPTTSYRADQFVSEDKRKARSVPFDRPGKFAMMNSLPAGGEHRLQVNYLIDGANQMTSNTAWLIIRVNGVEVARELLAWGNPGMITVRGKAKLEEGENQIEFEILEGDPPLKGETKLALRIRDAQLHGPLDGSYRVAPKGYDKIFIDGPPPNDAAARADYLQELIRHWGLRLWRRPVDDTELKRFVQLAGQAGSFERSFGRVLTAMLASPNFIFRTEAQAEPDNPGKIVPISEFALASRLSYFFWRSAPDELLLNLAGKDELRENLRAQVDRMLKDKKIERLVSSFTGQWLHARDIQLANKKPQLVLGPEADYFGIKGKKDAAAFFNNATRQAMRQETEMMFAYVLAEDRSVLDFLTADYTFLNEALAKNYQIEGIKGKEMRKVALPPDSPRGGILGQGTFLVLTSDKTRTSPVKRGMFVLENLLATPPPPPPPNVPTVEEQLEKRENKNLTMLELMALHRKDKKCAGCHARIDPIGVALENFNALGMWRAEEKGQPIETSGTLITGESFGNARELAEVLATSRRGDFYRCLTEKLLTYAIGRGVEYYDAPAVELITGQLEADGGRMSTLIYGIVESVPFQKRRGDGSRF